MRTLIPRVRPNPAVRLGTPLGEVVDLLIPLDPSADEPLHRQLYQGMREAIRAGRLGPGVRIPSTRRLAEHLGVSRSTVLVAFDQLVAEGYVVGAVGSGSYVATELPDPLPERGPAPIAPAGVVAPVRLSTRGRSLQGIRQRAGVPYPRPFWPGVPPLDEFPRSLWARLAARRYRRIAQTELFHGPAAGYAPLREAIAAHLTASRGVRAGAGQVIVLSSAQEGMELIGRVLLDPGDAAWIEDPNWSGARGALVSAGATVVPVPVDDDGLRVADGMARAPEARLAYVCPSHQFPAGVTLSLDRRRALLDWAGRNEAWILEDDYDSEYLFSKRPLTALQGLDTAGRVLYVGTFNKTLFPSLRLAYLVVPECLVEPFLAVRGIGGQHAPVIDQAILADFLAEGHYASHMRRMRTLCRQRRDFMIAAASREAPDLLQIGQTEGGLHVVGWLPPGSDDRKVSAAAERFGVRAGAISSHYLGSCPRPGLVLGYAGFTRQQIDGAMHRLADALRSLHHTG